MPKTYRKRSSFKRRKGKYTRKVGLNYRSQFLNNVGGWTHNKDNAEVAIKQDFTTGVIRGTVGIDVGQKYETRTVLFNLQQLNDLAATIRSTWMFYKVEKMELMTLWSVQSEITSPRRLQLSLAVQKYGSNLAGTTSEFDPTDAKLLPGANTKILEFYPGIQTEPIAAMGIVVNKPCFFTEARQGATATFQPVARQTGYVDTASNATNWFGTLITIQQESVEATLPFNYNVDYYWKVTLKLKGQRYQRVDIEQKEKKMPLGYEEGESIARPPYLRQMGMPDGDDTPDYELV